MAQGKEAAGRPLSPHLQIYRPLLTMVMSILHRITGVALYLGSFLFVWWLIAAGTTPAYFDFVTGILVSIPGRLVLLGFTWALLHHFLGGLRHLLWDTGRGFSKEAREGLALATISGSLVLTLVVWIVAYMVRGG